MKPPLSIFVLWHPEFPLGVKYAELIFSEFNRKIEDPLARGINIPVFFRQKPPLEAIPFTDYQFVVIIALVDSSFVLDQTFKGQLPEFLRQTVENAPSNALVIPVAIEKSAFSIGLNNLNFFRLYESSDKEDFLINTLAHEITRHLYNLNIKRTDSPPPLRLFISHAKVDGVDIARQIKGFVDSSLRLHTFFDANDIAIGYDFTKEIESNIKNTVVIAIHTDNYSSREWCRREVLLAKQHNRPIVVLNCFKDGESRSFPYMANVLTVHFTAIEDSVLPRLITAVMKETLRLKYQELFLAYLMKKTSLGAEYKDSISAYPPELVTVLKKRAHLNGLFIYPDPPIGSEEMSVIKELDSNIRYITPSELYSLDEKQDPPKGKIIGISISESMDIERLGMSLLHLQNCMVEIARFLLNKGYSLAYGGDLSYDSPFNFLEILFQLGMTYGGDPNKRIINYSAFPLYTKISESREAEIRRVATIKRVNPDPSYDEWTNIRYENVIGEKREYLNWLFAAKDIEAKEIWAKSLTRMREVMAGEIAAQIVIGGKTENYLGRLPGILEEAEISIGNNITIYISEAFGGASKEIAKKEPLNKKLISLNKKILIYPGKERFPDIEGFIQTL